MITLTALVLHANISEYTRASWLRGAEWKPNTLYLTQQVEVNWATKHWLPLWREIVPDMRVQLLPPRVNAVKPPTKYPSLKATGPARRYRDLLDSQES